MPTLKVVLPKPARPRRRHAAAGAGENPAASSFSLAPPGERVASAGEVHVSRRRPASARTGPGTESPSSFDGVDGTGKNGEVSRCAKDVGTECDGDRYVICGESEGGETRGDEGRRRLARGTERDGNDDPAVVPPISISIRRRQRQHPPGPAGSEPGIESRNNGDDGDFDSASRAAVAAEWERRYRSERRRAHDLEVRIAALEAGRFGFAAELGGEHSQHSRNDCREEDLDVGEQGGRRPGRSLRNDEGGAGADGPHEDGDDVEPAEPARVQGDDTTTSRGQEPNPDDVALVRGILKHGHGHLDCDSLHRRAREDEVARLVELARADPTILEEAGGPREEEEEWDVIEVLPAGTDKICMAERCSERAVATWADISNPSTDPWHSCLDCQRRDFDVDDDGWPYNFVCGDKENRSVDLSDEEEGGAPPRNEIRKRKRSGSGETSATETAPCGSFSVFPRRTERGTNAASVDDPASKRSTKQKEQDPSPPSVAAVDPPPRYSVDTVDGMRIYSFAEEPLVKTSEGGGGHCGSDTHSFSSLLASVGDGAEVGRHRRVDADTDADTDAGKAQGKGRKVAAAGVEEPRKEQKRAGRKRKLSGGEMAPAETTSSARLGVGISTRGSNSGNKKRSDMSSQAIVGEAQEREGEVDAAGVEEQTKDQKQARKKCKLSGEGMAPAETTSSARLGVGGSARGSNGGNKRRSDTPAPAIISAPHVGGATTKNDLWDAYFERLQQFRAKHGHIRVKKGEKFGRWFHLQRTQYRTSTLPPEKKALLDSVGFARYMEDESRKETEAKEREWDDRIRQLTRFKANHGHLDVGGQKNVEKLRSWIASVRYARAKGDPNELLTEARLTQLEEIGFVWDRGERARQKRVEECRVEFETMLNELIKFRERNGHMQTHYLHNKELHAWIEKLRKLHFRRKEGEKTTLTDEMLEKLEAAQFEWRPPSSNSVSKSVPAPMAEESRLQWQSMYGSLKSFKELNDHLVLPPSNQYKQLKSWMNVQRVEYRKWERGEASKMTKERMEALDSIGFEFDPRSRRAEESARIWREHLEELRKCKERYGSFLDIPRTEKCYVWMNTQRIQYHAWKRGDKSSMTDERKAGLDELGFDWTPRAVGLSLQCQRKWDESYEKLRDFKRMNSHLDVPEDQVQLYNWVRAQRTDYQKMKRGVQIGMTEERKARLDDLDFEWNPVTGAERTWFTHLARLRAHKELSGTIDVSPKSDQKLHNWVRLQHFLYRKWKRGEDSSMTDERCSLLEQLGFVWKPAGRYW